MQIAEMLHGLVQGEDLSMPAAQQAMREILTGDPGDAVLAAFLTALRMKGESVGEIAAFAREMRAHAIRIRSRHRVVLDTCGTGGDNARTFNISTLAALAIAGCGVPVAKHGNRAVSSRCGSADLLERLGMRIAAPASLTRRCLDRVGFAFLFAPVFHRALGKVARVRKQLGFRTVFNTLGPLCNPAGANCQLLGVAHPELAAKAAHVLKKLKIPRAFVVCGMDGMDEVSLSGGTLVYELRAGRISRRRFRPESVGLRRVKPSDLYGGTPADNAAIARGILRGGRGPKRDAVVLNAAFGLVAAGHARHLKQGMKMAAESLDSGRAKNILDRVVAMTQGSAART